MDTEEISHHPKEQLEKLHRHNPNARWLIDNPSYETVKWCVRKNIRAVAYGGTMKRIKIPCVGSSLSGLLMQTHQYFQSIGHKRIVHLIERPSEISINIYERYLKKQHLTFRKNYHLPNIDEITAKGFHKMLEGLFSITPPTAIMVSSNRQLIGLLGFCIQHNIKIAEDLSVVISKDSMNIDWFTPGLSYYRRAWERETQELSNLIEHYPANLPEILNVPLQLVNKGSIIPLKKGSSSSRRSHRRD
ncbi:MAG: substrate-binding domain-containing protein [Akkermansiaceae bacterium]